MTLILEVKHIEVKCDFEDDLNLKLNIIYCVNNWLVHYFGFFQYLKIYNSQTTRDRDLKFGISLDPKVGFDLNPTLGVYLPPCPWGGVSKSGHWLWVPTLEAHNSETNRAIGLQFGGLTDLDPN